MILEQKTVFVTGGTGLLGSHLLFSLASGGRKIIALRRQNSNLDFVRKVFGYYSDKPADLFKSIEWVESDLRNSDFLKKTIKGSDQVYHCAAVVSFENSRKEEIIKTNTLVTSNIVKACLELGIGKLCHVSSTAALGAAKNKIIVSEDHHWDDSDIHSAYSVSKHLSEVEVWEGIKHGLSAVIVNPSVIFGPGNWNAGSSMFFSKIAKGMPFYTSGVTGYVDVRDVVKSMVLLMNSPVSNERFIISAENLSYKQVFWMIADSMGVRKPYIPIPELASYPVSGILKIMSLIRPGKSAITPETLHSAFSKVYLDNKKIREATGISFIPISQSVADTSRIYRAEKGGTV